MGLGVKRIPATSVVPKLKRKMCKVQYVFEYRNGNVTEHSGLFRSKNHFWSFADKQEKIRNGGIRKVTITSIREGIANA